MRDNKLRKYYKFRTIIYTILKLYLSFEFHFNKLRIYSFGLLENYISCLRGFGVLGFWGFGADRVLLIDV